MLCLSPVDMNSLTRISCYHIMLPLLIDRTL